MSYNRCVSYNSVQSFVISLILHIAILFTLLGLIFLFYISNSIRHAFMVQIRNITDDAFNTFVSSLNDKEVAIFNNYLYKNKDYLDKMRDFYNNPAPETKINNEWLTKMIIITICFLILITLIVVAILKFKCGYDIHLVRIIIINVMIFIFVGAIELLFFNNIITKYIPIKPSFILQSIYAKFLEVFPA